jgi:hypothetical protein
MLLPYNLIAPLRYLIEIPLIFQSQDVIRQMLVFMKRLKRVEPSRRHPYGWAEKAILMSLTKKVLKGG